MILQEAKQIIAVRTDLGMDVGKIVAQTAHASLGVILAEMDEVDDTLVLSLKDPEIRSWIKGKFVKIAVEVKSEKKLIQLYEKVKNAGLRATLIEDAGRTVFNGVPTKTCLAVGPHFIDRIDPYTKKYPLLKFDRN